MGIEVVKIIGTVISVITGFIAVWNFMIKPMQLQVDFLRKDLATLTSTISNLTSKLEGMAVSFSDLKERVAINEQSLKTAHKRIDKLEERVK